MSVHPLWVKYFPVSVHIYIKLRFQGLKYKWINPHMGEGWMHCKYMFTSERTAYNTDNNIF